MGKKNRKSSGATVSARATDTMPEQVRDLDRITADMISWVESGYSPQGAMALPAVFASVRLIASTINQLPIEVTNGEPPEWLLHPRKYGGELDLPDLVQFAVTSMLLQGAAYLQCVRVGESWRLDALRPSSVQANVSASGPVAIGFLVDGQRMQRVPVVAREIGEGVRYLLHIPYLVTPEHPQGLSPIGAARTNISGYLGVERQAANLIDSGTYSGGRLESEQEITESTALRYQAKWVENRKLGAVPVLGSGMRYVNDIINPSDAQWLESRQFNSQQVAQMFGIPPSYLGMTQMGGSSSQNYANAQDDDRRYRRNALGLPCQQISDAISQLLPPGRSEAENQRLIFDFTRWEGETDAAAPDTDSVDNPQQ